MTRVAVLALALFPTTAFGWHPGATVPVDPAEVGVDVPAGTTLRAVDGDRTATAEPGGVVVVEHSEWGDSTIATAGPIGGLAMGPRSWTWSVTGQGVLEDVTRARIAVAPSPGLLAAGDLDGNGLRDLVVLHPGALGVLFDGGEREALYDLPGDPITGLQLADVDANGCGDLLVRRGDAWHAVLGACADTPAPEPPRPSLVVGTRTVELPTMVGEIVKLQLVDEGQQAVYWSKRGGPGTLHLSSSGILTYFAGRADVGQWDIPVRLESSTALVRKATVRLLVYPAGTAGVATLGSPSPQAPPGGEERRFDGPDPGIGQVYQRPWKDNFWTPRGCAIAGGVATAVSVDVNPDWERLGQPLFATGSPLVALTCDGSKGRWGWFLGSDSAPNNSYVMTTDLGGVHVLAAFAGVSYGGDKVLVGAYGTGGILMAGAGGRLRWTPFRSHRGGLHGVELRVTLLLSEVPSAEGQLAYTYRLPNFRP